MTVAEMLKQMRDQLRSPRQQGTGTYDLVGVECGRIWITEEAAKDAIDEFERLCLTSKALDEKPTALQRLGIQALLRGAYIEDQP